MYLLIFLVISFFVMQAQATGTQNTGNPITKLLKKSQEVAELIEENKITENDQKIKELKSELKSLEEVDPSLFLVAKTAEIANELSKEIRKTAIPNKKILTVLADNLLFQAVWNGIKIKKLTYKELILQPEGQILRQILIRFIEDLGNEKLSDLDKILESNYSIRLLACLIQPKTFSCENAASEEQRKNLGQVLEALVTETNRFINQEKFYQIRQAIYQVKRAINQIRQVKQTPEEQRRELGKQLGKSLGKHLMLENYSSYTAPVESKHKKMLFNKKEPVRLISFSSLQ